MIVDDFDERAISIEFVFEVAGELEFKAAVAGSIPGITPFAGGTGLAFQLRPETFAVDGR